MLVLRLFYSASGHSDQQREFWHAVRAELDRAKTAEVYWDSVFLLRLHSLASAKAASAPLSMLIRILFNTLPADQKTVQHMSCVDQKSVQHMSVLIKILFNKAVVGQTLCIF